MATRNMPGTPKQRSVSRPAQGKGGRETLSGKPKGLRPLKATPRFSATHARKGSLDAS